MGDISILQRYALIAPDDILVCPENVVMRAPKFLDENSQEGLGSELELWCHVLSIILEVQDITAIDHLVVVV